MAQQHEIQALSASSRMATGNRNRTSGLSLLLSPEDAAFSNHPSVSSQRTRDLPFIILVAALALLGGSAFAQVSYKVNNDPQPTTPGTKYPTIETCNLTNAPQLLQGWKFRTKDFAGYTQAWLGTLTREVGPPVEYTQLVSANQQQQMQTGMCRSAPTDYIGTLPAGQNATIFDLQSLVKTGSCSEQPPYKDADPIACTQIATDVSYYGSQCFVDSLGINGGVNFGGLVSTFNGQTQILAAMPSSPVTLNNMQVKWDPRSLGGPQYMMSLAMAQEILNVDMQFLAAIGGKETMFGFVEAGQESKGSISEWASFNRDDDAAFSPWEIENTTFARTMQSYPQFYPKYGPCMGKYRDVTSASSCSGDDGRWNAAAGFYMHTPGTNGTGSNSPQLANSVLSSALVWYWLYDGLVQSTDLCFADAIVNGQDTRLALAALIPGYNLGPNSGFEGPLKDKNLKNDPNASSRFATGNGDYRTNVFRLLDHLVDASKKSNLCGGTNAIYDAEISFVEIQRFFFGGSSTAGIPAAQGDGGLLLHFDLETTQRQALFDDLKCAYDRLKGKAPSTTGKDAISYRYDWLTILRVAKTYLPSRRRLVPVQSDFRMMVDRNNKNPVTCSGKELDSKYPSLTIISPAQGSVVAPIENPGFKFTFTGSDNVAVTKAEWTFDQNWVVWNPATKTTGNNYEFHVSCKRPDYPKKNQKTALWIRTTDDCGNSTVQELTFTTHSTANCGDPPVPPQVATPQATPPGQEFSALSLGVNVTLSVATPGATILYTLDGTDPDSVVGGSTKAYAGPIPITATTTLKARAVAPDMLKSGVMTEQYTKVEPGKTPKPEALPPGQNFTGSLSVTLVVKGHPSAAIFYTLDGSVPAAVEGGATRRYAAPIILTGNTVITAIATKPDLYQSETMVERYTNIPPIAIRQAWYLDEDGDGRIEKAVVLFDKPLPLVPDKLGFTIQAEDDQMHAKTAAKAEMALAPGDASKVIITFATPFPIGVTSLKNSASSGVAFKQDNIPLLDGGFAVADSAAPVIIKAVITEGDSAQPMKSIAITYSEPMRGPAASQTAWIFKRAGDEMASADVRIGLIQGVGDRVVNILIDTASNRFPIRGDSVAIALTSEIADMNGRTPKVKRFRVLEGDPAASKPVRFSILFPNGSTDLPSRGSITVVSDAVFIPLGLDGNALPGSRDQGRCPGCVAKEGDTWVGPVFKILTPGPLSYSFKIFNNVGEFVAEGKGRIEEKDLDLLKKDRAGVNYEIPVVWTGNTTKGRKAGTGAYVVLAVFNLEKDMRTGAGPSKHTDKKVFGLIRNL